MSRATAWLSRSWSTARTRFLAVALGVVAAVTLIAGSIIGFSPFAEGDGTGSAAPLPPDSALAPSTTRAPTTTAAPKKPSSTTSTTSTTAPSRIPATTTAVVASVVSGDELELAGGTVVRLLGIDAPDFLQCGFQEATAALAALVAGREVTLIGGVPEKFESDGKVQRFVEVDNVDVNLAMVDMGHAVAMPENPDPEGRHPRFGEYKAADEASSPRVTCNAPVGGGSSSVYYRSCSEARQATVTPLYRGQEGYRPGLDSDSDGVACEL